MWTLGMMQSFLYGDGLLGTEIDDIAEVTAALGESGEVDAVLGVGIYGDKVSVTSSNGSFKSQLVLLSKLQVLQH